MLASEYGGVRPWEMELLKPSELMDMYRYRTEVEKARASNG